jgi:hypothetical protein
VIKPHRLLHRHVHRLAAPDPPANLTTSRPLSNPW